MTIEEKKVWGIHTSDDTLFLHENTIAIGWKDFGDCSIITPSREAFKEHYLKSYPSSKKGAIATSAGMLYRFTHEMKIGDYVVFPSKSDRKINIGIVESEFIYAPQAALYVQQRNVEIPIPDITIQRAIAQMYSVYIERKKINEQLKAQIKDICPILIRGSLEEA